MAYRLKEGESVAENVQRIVLEELESAADGLTNAGDKRDEPIHEARKSVKKIRGILRLVRPQLGGIYAQETERFRNIGHQLSDIRDAAARLEIFDGVIEKYKDTLQSSAFRGIRRGLEEAKKEAEESPEAAKVVQTAIGAFHSAAKVVKTWPTKDDGFPAIAPGLELTYRSGRRALRAARKQSTPEALHYFRRRAKDHWYHVRLLESLWTEVMQAHESSLKKLEQWLGDDHNLVVLREKLEHDPEKYGGEGQIQTFLLLADHQQNELREEAISMGRRVYKRKTKQFTTEMADLWKAWKEQPDSMKQEQKEERKGAKKDAHPAYRKKATSAA